MTGMKNDLSKLHETTYDMVADEYEDRVETLRPTTEKALSNFTNLLHPNSKILDIGCAVGYTTEILSQSGMSVDGIDIAPKMIGYAQRRNPNSHFVVGDFLETTYQKHSYDGILMYAFLHLFPKDIALEFLDKAVSITKPAGLIFTGTTKSEKASEGFEIKHDYKKEVRRYRKRWTKAEIESVFRSRDLEVVDYAEKIDEFGKVWMDYIVRTPA
jgi:2-polyprenyl-3-methyl-5-hydroxy-6-metoxy-1,4-benzoquinol methylase